MTILQFTTTAEATAYSFSDGFETGDTSAWGSFTGNATVQTQYKYSGIYALKNNQTDFGFLIQNDFYNLDNTAVSVSLSVMFPTLLPDYAGYSSIPLVKMYNSSHSEGYTLLQAYCNETDKLCYWRFADSVSGNVVGKTAIQTNTWYNINFTQAQSIGNSTLTVNGTTEITTPCMQNGFYGVTDTIEIGGQAPYGSCSIIDDATINVREPLFTRYNDFPIYSGSFEDATHYMFSISGGTPTLTTEQARTGVQSAKFTNNWEGLNPQTKYYLSDGSVSNQGGGVNSSIFSAWVYYAGTFTGTGWMGSVLVSDTTDARTLAVGIVNNGTGLQWGVIGFQGQGMTSDNMYEGWILCGGTPQTDTWQNVTIYTDNTLGARNAVATVWIDGIQIFTKSDLTIGNCGYYEVGCNLDKNLENWEWTATYIDDFALTATLEEEEPEPTPTHSPTATPSPTPTSTPTPTPTVTPSTTSNPTQSPTINPTSDPSTNPTINPTQQPTNNPTPTLSVLEITTIILIPLLIVGVSITLLVKWKKQA